MLRSARAALLAAALAAHAGAREGEPETPEEPDMTKEAMTRDQLSYLHGQIDADRDGRISMGETLDYSGGMRRAIAAKDVRSLFVDMDLDRDGRLSLDEVLKDLQLPGEGDAGATGEGVLRRDLESQKFSLADANGDGFLDEDELPALFFPESHSGVLELTAKATLAQKDEDKDGFLSLREFWGGTQEDGEELFLSDGEKEEFRKIDTDGDGRIDFEEAKAWVSGRIHAEHTMKKLFDLADTDRDNLVTADELSAAREQLAQSEVHDHIMEWAQHI